MARKHFTPEEIIGKLRQAEVMLSHDSRAAEACKAIGVTEQTYYRWRRDYVWPTPCSGAHIHNDVDSGIK